ncbi:MAG TPA: hypothetical protein VJY35_11825, partial [Candidatus Eisenbacteria bacterium]|nr:hypothetical protein [Candidatus Eisenbacteria bacterium]
MTTRRRPPGRRAKPARIPAAEWLLLAAVLLAGALLRVWILQRTSGLTMDSPLYVGMAARLGHVLPPLGPAHHGYPALVAAASALIPGHEWPGRIVSLVAGLALIALTWALARRRVPAWGAAAAAGLVALHPLLALSSGTVMTEASFQAITYASLLVLDLGRTLPAAGLMGIAYWVRPEAMVIAAAALPALQSWRRRAAWVLVFVVAAIPEVAMLSAERGTFTLTPKTNLVAAAGAAQDDAEWHAAADSTAPPMSAAEWIRRGLPAAAARYPDRLMGQLARVHQTWPLPLVLLSVLGACLRPGLLLAPLAIL